MVRSRDQHSRRPTDGRVIEYRDWLDITALPTLSSRVPLSALRIEPNFLDRLARRSRLRNEIPHHPLQSLRREHKATIVVLGERPWVAT